MTDKDRVERLEEAERKYHRLVTGQDKSDHPGHMQELSNYIRDLKREAPPSGPMRIFF